MSNTNENILKSLAVLEQNLKDIHSAKEQVVKVVESSADLAQVIESYKSSFEGLSANVKDVLEESRNFNLDTIAKLSEQTDNFNKEVKRLIEFDFTKSFKSIETEIVKQFEKDLQAQLVAFDTKEKDLQVKIRELKNQISRLEVIDLEAHFAKHQKTLSEIFSAINSVNLTLTNVTQSLNVISQGLNTISNLIDTSTKEIISKQNDFKNELNIRINNIENNLINKISEIENQNSTLRKEMKTNRLILICGIVIVVGLMVFNIFVK